MTLTLLGLAIFGIVAVTILSFKVIAKLNSPILTKYEMSNPFRDRRNRS